MRFGFEQVWDASAAQVLEVYLDPEFWEGLADLTATSAPQVLDVDRRGDRALVRLRYALKVELPREAARFIDPGDVAWTEETEWDLRSLRAEVRFVPAQASGLMRASATAELTDAGDGATRRVTGELKVRIPLVGGRVERVVVEGIGDHLVEEADAVAARLD